MRFDKEQQQAAFEKWFTSEDGPFLGEKLLYKDAFGNYICPEAYTRFEGWQAALMQASQPDDAIVRYDDGTNVYLDHFAGGAHAHGEWEELGLRFESKDGEITYKQFKRTDTIEQASQQQTDRAALADLVKTARKDLLAGRYIAAEAMLQVIESALSTPATEQASQSQGAICKINIPDPYNKGCRIIGWRIKDDGSHLLDQMNRLP